MQYFYIKIYIFTSKIDTFTSTKNETNLYEFDHIYIASDTTDVSENEPKITIIMYGDITTEEFNKMHEIIKEKAEKREVKYVLRYHIISGNQLMSLAGYGVELALKSMEYKSMDDSTVESKTDINTIEIGEDEDEIEGFLFGVLKKRKPEYSNQLSSFKAQLTGSNKPFESLKVWDLKDIGYQATQRIVTSTNPLRLMKEISQNFPNHAVGLSKIKVNETLKSQVKKNIFIEEGKSLLLINGRIITPESINVFELYNIIQVEIAKYNSLKKLKINKETIEELLSIGTPEKSNDLFKIKITEAVQFINNLESDEQYSNWPKNVNEIFRRVWPGSFRYIGKNFYTCILIVNFADPKILETVTLIESILNQNVPIRFGFVFTSHSYVDYNNQLKLQSTSDPENQFEFDKNDANVNALKIFISLKLKYGIRNAMQYLRILESLIVRDNNNGYTENNIKTAFNNIINRITSENKVTAFENSINDKEAEKIIRKMNYYAYELGIQSNIAAFLNGEFCNTQGGHELIQDIVQKSFQQVNQLQILVRQGRIRDNSDIYNVLLNQPNVFSRFNLFVLPSTDNPLSFKDLSSSITLFPLLSHLPKITLPSKVDEIQSISHLIYCDFTQLVCIKLIAESLINLKDVSSSPSVRYLYLDSSTIINNNNNDNNNNNGNLLIKSIFTAYNTQLYSKTYDFINEIINNIINENKLIIDINESLLQEYAKKMNFNIEKYEVEWNSDNFNKNYLNPLKEFIKEQDIKYNEIEEIGILITNGRLLKVPKTTLFTNLDFKLLSGLEYQQRSKKIEEIITKMENVIDVPAEEQTSELISNLIMTCVSLVGRDQQFQIEKLNIPNNIKPTLQLKTQENAAIKLQLIINPLSIAAQKITPVVESLSTYFNVVLDFYFNPKEESDLPLKNYYTFVLPNKLDFNSNINNNNNNNNNNGIFTQLPVTRLLTLNLDTPETWLVTPIVAKYDLDNIKLEQIDDNIVYAQFELQNIIVEGNCYDITNQNAIPPRGLEIILSTNVTSINGINYKDTIVMSNYGYFQLKANPGLFNLELKPNSKSIEIYQFKSTTTSTSSTTIIDSFLGNFQFINVEKRPDKVNVQLLSDSNDEKGIWDSISGLWSDKNKNSNNNNKNNTEETIHVFSLASGHLYERFLRIMMLSVIKNTKSPVKFWLLANFLSPKFKDFIPHMAEKYNFEYELVTYKWPSWLHKQTEKQRVIWGYKILFLDVLFPLDLKKVIYVDADQVVRSDLKELWTLNLEGAPYAYTPFCNDKPEMNGFRFWNQGFWQNHLRGLPYHISALYVVDLVQFRKLAAGDQLRANYAQLSQDPNSLANLDQDLPNYLQHQVKIFSLPPEWLWCETWCSDTSKTKAKTIDLVYNIIFFIYLYIFNLKM